MSLITHARALQLTTPLNLYTSFLFGAGRKSDMQRCRHITVGIKTREKLEHYCKMCFAWNIDADDFRRVHEGSGVFEDRMEFIMRQTDSSYDEDKRYISGEHDFSSYSNRIPAHEQLDIAGCVAQIRKERAESRKRKTVQVQAGNSLCFFIFIYTYYTIVLQINHNMLI